MRDQLEIFYAKQLDRAFHATLFQNLPGLNHSGGGYTAFCPFHEDTLPTFLIYEDRPRYFCFACGAQGDWIEYLLRRNIAETFVQALRLLEEQTTMPITISEATWRYDMIYSEILEAVQNLCIAELWSEKALEARAYLSQRGYTQDEIEGMGLGAFPGMSSIMENLQEKFSGHMLNTVIERIQAGCVGKPTITIPYRDSAGRLMGMYGRSITDGEGTMPYRALTDMERLQNTPFLMYHSRGCADVVVVDGFMDALLADRIGIKGVLGVGRSGLTPDFLDTAVFYGAQRFLLSLSSDENTQLAIERIIALGLDVAVVNRPDKYPDTDAYIRGTCINKFGKLLEKTIPGEEWLMKHSRTLP